MPTVRFQLRRDTAANWSSVNPILGNGEPGLERDTRLVKYGDGATHWNDLAYSAADLPEALTALADVEPVADGDYAVGGITISTESGLITDISAVTPTASSVSVDTSVNPPLVSWQMPDVRGWAIAVVFRGTSSAVGSSVAVSDPSEGIGGLFAPMTFEDDVLAPGSYWWWVRIYDAASNLLSTSGPATGTVA